MAKPQLRKPRKKVDPVKAIKVGTIDYKDTAMLWRFISDCGKIRAHRVIGISVQEQRKIVKIVKNAHETALLPYSSSAHQSETRAMTTKPILTHDVSHLDSAGEIVEVEDGCARNHLLPRKLTTPWTKDAQRQIDQMVEARHKRSIESLEHAQTTYAWPQENVVTVSATAGDSGCLFDAITTVTLADVAKAVGSPTVNHRKIQVVPSIRSTGRYSTSMRLHVDVVVPLEVDVISAR